MEVTQPTVPTAPVPPGQTSSGSALSSDFETFLLMLTTQMENQDPLNPIESSDFAVQLATFSGVEQQVRTNDLLSSMVASAGIADLSSWVGLDARVEGAVTFRGQPVLIDVGVETPGASRNLVVRGEDGSVLRTDGIPAGVREIEWAGLDLQGNPLQPGNYDLTVEQVQAGEVIKTTPVASYSGVIEARRTGTGTELLLENGSVVSADQIDAVRAP